MNGSRWKIPRWAAPLGAVWIIVVGGIGIATLPSVYWKAAFAYVCGIGLLSMAALWRGTEDDWEPILKWLRYVGLVSILGGVLLHWQGII